MKEGESIVRFAKEAVWGTDPAAAYTTAIQEGDGFQIADEVELVKKIANSHWPVTRSHEPIKQVVKATYKTPLYADSAEALIKMGVVRATVETVPNELESYTWHKKLGDGTMVALTGGKVAQMTLEIPASGEVMLTQEWIFKAIATTTGIVAGTYPTGPSYKGGANTLSVNAVACSTLESGTITVNNNLEEGPVNGSGLAIAFLDAGLLEYSGSLKAKYASNAWNAFRRALTNFDITAFPAVLTLLNSTAAGLAKNLVLTFASGTLKAPRAPLEASEQGKTVFQNLELVHQTTAPEWAYPA
jgi:hypothetical protein